MIHKMIVSAIVAGLLGGYVVLLYALVQIAFLIDRSYMMSLTM